MINIRGENLNIDILEELLPYFENNKNTRITSEKIIASSPFRTDSHPSFFVNLTGEYAGVWGDSGATVLDEYKSGDLPKLLAYFRNESVEETIDYLFSKYQINRYESLELPKLTLPTDEWIPLGFQKEELADDYLLSRGIAKGVAQQSGVVDLGDKVAFHWYDFKHKIVAIKYRFKDRKDFYYAKGGKPLKNYLYNLQLTGLYKFQFIWITEGECDALSVQAYCNNSLGVALGGASFSDEQAIAILRTGIKQIVIATDNDRQGKSARTKLVDKLSHKVSLYEVNLKDCKDVNEYVIKYHSLPYINQININPFVL